MLPVLIILVLISYYSCGRHEPKSDSIPEGQNLKNSVSPRVDEPSGRSGSPSKQEQELTFKGSSKQFGGRGGSNNQPHY